MCCRIRIKSRTDVLFMFIPLGTEKFGEPMAGTYWLVIGFVCAVAAVVGVRLRFLRSPQIADEPRG